MDKLIHDFSFGLFIWQLLVFVALIFLLKKYAWKPILDAVNAREESIEGALKAAEKARKEMKALQSDNEAILKEAREERERILKEARDMKNKIVAEAKEAASAEADKTVAAAKATIEAASAALLNFLNIIPPFRHITKVHQQRCKTFLWYRNFLLESFISQ